MNLAFEKLMLVTIAFSLTGCIGSPVWLNKNSHQDIVNFLSEMPNQKICKGLEKGKNKAQNSPNDIETHTAIKKAVAASEEVFSDRGYDKNYCNDPEKYEQLHQYYSSRTFDDYYIDGLHATVEKMKEDSCFSGGIYKIKLEGAINPDSTFALERLLDKSPDCRDQNGQVISNTQVILSSLGGFLEDGYNMGRTLRKAGATTVIQGDKGCASSCAVAFLGGANRMVEENGVIMFHAPYQLVENSIGTSFVKPDCNVGEETLASMKAYYTEMVGRETGNRLFERTMWYCSNSDGWVIAGGNAAKLYGIATE